MIMPRSICEASSMKGFPLHLLVFTLRYYVSISEKVIISIGYTLRWLQNSFVKFFKIIFDEHQMAEPLIG